MIILAFKFALSTTEVDIDTIAPAVLWITFLFAGMYGLTASFGKEKDKETINGLLLCPADRVAIYLGKVISNLVILFIIAVASLVLFAVFFSYNYEGNLGFLILVVVLGISGFVIIGTLISAISVNTKSRELLLPIMLIPLVIFTIIMPSVTATTVVLNNGSFSTIFEQMRFLITFDIVYFIIGVLLFDYVIEE